MNLYLVRCICEVVDSIEETRDVYVVAPDSTRAEEGAKDLVGKLEYKVDDRVDEIELIASVNSLRAECLLVLPS